jgi:hypothetical protein
MVMMLVLLRLENQMQLTCYGASFGFRCFDVQRQGLKLVVYESNHAPSCVAERDLVNLQCSTPNH